MAVKLSTVGILGVSSVLVYSGVTGRPITGSLQAILQGKKLSSVPRSSSLAIIGGTVSGTPTSGVVTGNSAAGFTIAQDALQYQGHQYVLGGAPGSDGSGPWDCSSFASYVLGHDEGMTIPGGNWTQVTSNGTQHGPSSWSYLSSGLLRTINRKSVQAGDILIWTSAVGHMGIAINNTEMISALNPTLGTMVTTIDGGGPAAPLICRRLKAAT